MRIAVLGTGTVGRTLAAGLRRNGHDVVVGTRDAQRTLALTEPDAMGNPPLRLWSAEHADIPVRRYADAVTDADLLVNATSGAHTLDALRAAGLGRLDGVVLLDIANPLDFSHGMPPTLSVANTDSLAEQIQREFPGARVVKSLNTMSAHVMVDPSSLPDGGGCVFVSGNDADAKAVVTVLLREFGWADVIDLGDITSARGTEMWLPLWLRLWQAVGTPAFNLAVVR